MQTLRADNLIKSYERRTIIENISFQVEQGKIVGLMGPNGAGKTTSFYITVGLLSPDSGSIVLNNKIITKLPLHKRASLGIAYLPQNGCIFKKLTVEQNLLGVMELVGLKKPQRLFLLDKLLEQFKIAYIRKSLGASLSGGEKRRVEIARTLVLKPKFLLLDEPFAGVDPVTVQDLQSILLSLKNDGLGILITDHNVRETLQCCDEAYILAQGQIITRGKTQEILSNDQVKQLYLGHKFTL